MPTHVAFLRAVNLGGTRKTGSAELRAAFEAAGLQDVATFRTSGNVVFAAESEPRQRLAERIEAGLGEAFGFEVPVFLRTEAEILALAEYQPFGAEQLAASKGKPRVLLLAGRPRAAAKKRVLALATADDRLAFGERELFWLPRGGTQNSKLDSAAIGAALGQYTQRTKGTIDALVAKFFS